MSRRRGPLPPVVCDAAQGLVWRKGWPPGPWDSEPDDMRRWIDAATGVLCLLVRNEWGAWCGYVAVPKLHPWFALDGEDVRAGVHGGITFAGTMFGQGGGRALWWFGFDCNHFLDLAPGMPRGVVGGLTYRTMEYATGECCALARAVAREGRWHLCLLHLLHLAARYLVRWYYRLR